jgi:rubrerythrin
MLSTDIAAPDQLLSAALAIEREARRHYGEMATRMRHFGNLDTVELFERLADESRERAEQIAEWAELEGIELLECSSPVNWEDPLMPKTYDAEARDPYRSTPYKALAYAAHNADRAFNLYTHISAIAEDPQTKRYASILAGDALNRSRLLQSRRRRAYGTERRGPWQQQLDAALELRTAAELCAVAAIAEQRLTDLLSSMAEHYDELEPIVAQSRDTVEQCLQNMADAPREMAAPKLPYNMDNIGSDLHRDILLIFTESERAFTFYDTVMAHAFDEATMLAAQELSESALTRLKAIREIQIKHGIPPAT